MTGISHGWRRWSLILWLACWIPGCGVDRSVEPVADPDAAARFIVSARILAYGEERPLPGVSVQLAGEAAPRTAGPDGGLRLEDLPGGSYRLRLTTPGFAATQITLDLPTTGVTDPDRHLFVEWYLVPLDGRLDLLVLDQAQGLPVTGASVAVTDAAFGLRPDHRIQIDPGAATAVSGADGRLTLSPLPRLPLTLVAAPLDLDGDGRPELGTGTLLTPGRADSSGSCALVMPPFSGQRPLVVAADVADASGIHWGADFHLVFSCPMDTVVGRTVAQLTPQAGGPAIDLVPDWVSPIRLDLAPAGPLPELELEPYKLTLTARSAADGGDLRYENAFRWYTQVPSEEPWCLEVVPTLNLAAAADPIDFDTRLVELSWPAVAGAGGYRLHARNDRAQPQWQIIETVDEDWDSGTVTVAVTLPAAFDRFTVDDELTPFAGTAVSFCVVPRLAFDGAPGPPHPTLILRDEVPPSTPTIRQLGTASNPADTPEVLEFQILFDEYMDPATPLPVLEIREAGGDLDFVLDGATAEFAWEPANRVLVATLVVPPGADASGDEVRLILPDLTDLSGNRAAGLDPTPWTQIFDIGADFNFEYSTEGWVADHPIWEWGTPVYAPSTAHASARCWGTDLDDFYDPYLDGSVVSPSVRIPESSPLLSLWTWYRFQSNDVVQLWIDDGITRQVLSTFSGLNPNWVRRTLALAPYAGRVVRFSFRITSDSATQDWGFYFDDFKVTASSASTNEE